MLIRYFVRLRAVFDPTTGGIFDVVGRLASGKP